MFLEEVNEEEVLEEYGEVSFLRCNVFPLEFSEQNLIDAHLNVAATVLFYRNEMHCVCLTSLCLDLITSGHELISIERVSSFVNMNRSLWQCIMHVNKTQKMKA